MILNSQRSEKVICSMIASLPTRIPAGPTEGPCWIVNVPDSPSYVLAHQPGLSTWLISLTSPYGLSTWLIDPAYQLGLSAWLINLASSTYLLSTKFINN